MGKKKAVTIGYKYYLGIHFALCHGQVDALKAIYVDDKEAWTGSSSGGSVSIDKPSLFGGEKKEGGISGALDFLSGVITQAKNAYLASRLGSDIPAYRGIASVVLNQMYMGNNPYLKKWSFLVKRVAKRSNGSDMWYSSKCAIGNDMNPAHIVYECLTDTEWGLGYSSADIDETSFTACADTLYTEKFGLSILWDNQSSIEDFVKTILGHVDGMLFVDNTTGKFKMKLMRADYTLSSLTTLSTDTTIMQVEDLKCSMPDELVNMVVVKYWDPKTFKTNTVSVQDLAMIDVQGGIVSVTQDYGGITSGDLASSVAVRDLKVLSSPLVNCNVVVTREVGRFEPGDPVIINIPEYGIDQLVMRVLTINVGSVDDNSIKLALAQDVFSLDTANTFSAPQTTSWVPVSVAPTNLQNVRIIDIPYYTLAMYLGSKDADAMLAGDITESYLVFIAAKDNANMINAEVLSGSSSSTLSSDALLDFSPMATLDAAIGFLDSTLTMTASVGWSAVTVNVGDYGLMDDELMVITSMTISGGTVTLGVTRAIFDTVPAQHAAGSKLFIFSLYSGISQYSRVSGEVLYAKILPQTGSGKLGTSAASLLSGTFYGRPGRPYPPGNFQINSTRYPTEIISDNGQITISWAHRNRLTQSGTTIYAQTYGNITQESGATYSLTVKNVTSGTTLSSQTGLTGTSATVTLPAGQFTVKIELWSVRNNISSLFKQSCTFSYTLFHGTLLTESGDQFITENEANFILE